MKGLNFLVLRFSLLPLVSGVYKFQVLVSFPSLHLRILTRGLHQQGVVGGSSESSFVFNVPVWLIDQVPKMTWRCSLTSNLRQSALIFCRFLTIYHPFYGSRLYYGRGQGYLWIKMPQNVKKSSIWSPFLARGIEWRCFEVDEFFQGLLPVPCFCEKCPLRYLFFAWTSWSILAKAESFLCKNFGLV